MLSEQGARELIAGDYATNTVFPGLNYGVTGAVVPDSMGAVGPNHFVELLNYRIAVYHKSGEFIVQTNSANFFGVLDADGTNYPTGPYMVDPRILYDHESQRWVACALDGSGSGQVILAVSNDDNPTNLVTGWNRYLVRVKRPELFTDYPTMGMDANGIYVSVLHLGEAIR